MPGSSHTTSDSPPLGLHLLLAGGTAFLTVAAMVGGSALLALSAILSGVELHRALENPAWLVAGAAVSQGSVLLVVLGTLRFWRRYRNITPRAAAAELFPLGNPGFGAFFGGVLVTFGIAPLAIGVATSVGNALGIEESASAEVVRRAAAAPPLVFVLLLVCISVLPGVIEEALFRGYMTRLFIERPWVAWVVPSVLFGMVHLDIVQSTGTVILGLGFGWVRLKSGSILPVMLAHTLYNGTILVAARFVTETEEPGTVPIGLVAGGCVVALVGNWLISSGSKPRPTGASDD